MEALRAPTSRSASGNFKTCGSLRGDGRKKKEGSFTSVVSCGRYQLTFESAISLSQSRVSRFFGSRCHSAKNLFSEKAGFIWRNSRNSLRITSSVEQLKPGDSDSNESKESTRSKIFESNTSRSFLSPGPGVVRFHKNDTSEYLSKDENNVEAGKTNSGWILLPLGIAVFNFLSAAFLPIILLRVLGDTWLMQFTNAFLLDAIFLACLLLALKSIPRIFPELASSSSHSSSPAQDSSPSKLPELQLPLLSRFFKKSEPAQNLPLKPQEDNPSDTSPPPYSGLNSQPLHRATPDSPTKSLDSKGSEYVLNPLVEFNLPGFNLFQNSIRVLMICLPVAAIVLLSPMLIALKTSTLILSPFLVLYIAQFVVLQLPSFSTPFVFPVIPVIFQAYQLHQLNRGWYLTSEIIDALRSMEVRDDNVIANIGVMGTLRFFLILIALLCVANLAVQLFILPLVNSRTLRRPPPSEPF